MLVPGSALSHLSPILGCCLTHLPAAFPSLWRSSCDPGLGGEKPACPSSGSEKVQPPWAGQGVSSCRERLQPGRTLDGAEELEMVPRALCPAWLGLPWAPAPLLKGKPLAVLPQPLHLGIPGEGRDPLCVRGSHRGCPPSPRVGDSRGHRVRCHGREVLVCRDPHPVGEG